MEVLLAIARWGHSLSFSSELKTEQARIKTAFSSL